MVAQQEKLVMERGISNGFGRVIPLAPLFPIVTAAEPRHDEDSILVRKVKQMIRTQLPFEAHGVEPHVADEAHLLLLALRGFHEVTGCAPNPRRE